MVNVDGLLVLPARVWCKLICKTNTLGKGKVVTSAPRMAVSTNRPGINKVADCAL